MEQLPGADAIFLAMDTPNAPGHVGGVAVLDPSGARSFDFERVRRTVDERMRHEPRFTRVLRELPFGIDRPYLVDDPDFDVANHLRRIAVPAPGGMRELAELAGYLFSRPLDRDRPLWEMWYVEGLADSRVALVMKSHHCLMDGMAGAGLGELLCDLEPEPAESKPLLPQSERVEKSYGELEIALRAGGNLARMPARLARTGGRLLRQGAASLAATLRNPAAAVPRPPLVSFNTSVGKRRAVAFTSVPLAAVKDVKKHFDVTVNDVVLAISGSVIRRYLVGREELPDRPLVAMIAVSKREAGDASVGNQVTMVPLAWATHLADPVERLLEIHRNADEAKRLARHFDADALASIGGALPPGLVNFGMRTFGEAMAPLGVPGNVVVSNVRGTPVPLYVAGARIESMVPMSILAPSQGLNVTAVSYTDHIDIGFTVDPDLVPDVWQLADALPEALAELHRATEPAAIAAA